VSILRFDHVRKAFAGAVVLDDFCLEVKRGEVYGLLGPNGCGKSTAINILCNLLDPDRGSVEILGRRASADAARVIGLCPQEIALYRDLHPEENLRFFARIHGLAGAGCEERVSDLTRRFGLGRFARTRTGALSGGWQRRLNIAVALVHSPEVLVLDEPTSAVDLEARHELWRLIEALRAGGTTILLSTHQLDEAERLCSRIGIMKGGRIAREGSVAELLGVVPGKLVALIDAADELAVRDRAATLGWGVRHYAGRLACLLPEEASLRSVVDALVGIEVSAVSLQRVSLEHAFLEVIHQGRS
jgi:ABC-2 type transport system ATP-binding protein